MTMKQAKRDPSTASAQLLKDLDKRLEAIRKKQGPVPQIPEEQFEAMFRNQLRMHNSQR